ncbi:isoleucine--tRNA ligase [Streptomyces milbemycinicus]|uniref:isoleucine--tRNA ligase n=1 Tax=Streptomyces milbemycinicus TaxID=476552 RepID=UPI0033F4B47C
MGYPNDGSGGVPARPHFPDIELAVLDHWRANDVFAKSVRPRDTAAGEFVFYDGPPFAIGLPHYGHLLAGYAKDVVPRYQTMRGRRVERRFGWTTHGLPAELDAERQLGITAKSDIERMGVKEFNDVCRGTVTRYTEQWRAYVNRQARWVDLDDVVRTHDITYTESVLWAFKTLWDKGLIYQGHSIAWYCAHCETPLANNESSGRMYGADTHRDVDGTAVVVTVRLDTGELLRVATDHPWALPGMVAVAVDPDAAYEVVADGTVRTLTGKELVGRAFEPMFPFAAGRANKVIASSSADGSGHAVPVTPCFEERDHALAETEGLGAVYLVDATGRYTADAPPVAGLTVLESSAVVLGLLAESGALVSRRPFQDSRPHCWRCDSTLVQQAIPSWFLRVTQVRDRMLELNKQITWQPEHIKDGKYGKWVAQARDWNISRTRYWGAPIPVWMSDDAAYPRTDVYGSLDEIERDFGVRPADLHRPFIDELTRPNPDDPTGKSTMRRVPDVLDCWFETGAMPYASVHYPFENAEWFEANSPGQFVVEHDAQTRGWFYNMNVLSTALFDRPAFTDCTVLGTVLGNDGQAMSRAKGNYLDVNDLFDRDGADAMRWFLMSSPLMRAIDVEVSEEGSRQALRQVVLPLWNTWSFLVLYSGGVDGRIRTDVGHRFDRYLLAKTRILVEETGRALDEHDVPKACSLLQGHLDMLTNVYIRSSRQRFADGDREAVDTLHTALEVLCRLLAPLLPMIAERVWRGLTGGLSVHLTDWPSPDELPADPELVRVVDRVRLVLTTALAQRKSHHLRLRQPLSRLVVAAADVADMAPYADLLRDQNNVKDVEFSTDVAAHGRWQLVVNARQAGPRLGARVQQVIRAAAAGDWSKDESGTVFAAGIALEPGEYEERLAADGTAAVTALPDGTGLLVLDTDVTEQLADEGLARDLVRVVQQARRAAGFDVGEPVSLVVEVDGDYGARMRAHRDLVLAETSAERLDFGPVPGGFAGRIGEGAAVRVGVHTVRRGSAT